MIEFIVSTLGSHQDIEIYLDFPYTVTAANTLLLSEFRFPL
jgi:hypothetical protein